MTAINGNRSGSPIPSFNASINLKPTAGPAEAARVAQTALSWVRGQVPSRAQGASPGAPPLNASPRAAPAAITAKSSTAGVVGSLKTALDNLEHELKGFRPHQTEQFLGVVGTPNGRVPAEFQPAHRALTQALERFETATGRKDYDQVHRLLSQVQPQYALSSELLGLGLGTVGAYESASQARSLLVANRETDPALKDIRSMDIVESGGQPATLHIRHTSADEQSLRAAVGQALEAEGSKADVAFARLGGAVSLSPRQYERALDHAQRARSGIVESRSGNAPLEDVAYVHIKESGMQKPTLLIEHFSGDEAALKREVDGLVQRQNLDVQVAYRQLGPKPPLTEEQYVAALETAQKSRSVIMEHRAGSKALDAITYMHIKEGPGTASAPTLRIESDGRDGGALRAEVLDLLRRNRVLGDVEFGLTGGR